MRILKNYSILTAIWAIILTVLILLPGDEIPDQNFFPGFDKLVHTGMFGIFSFLFISALDQSGIRRAIGINALICFLVVFSYSYLLEYLQNFIPGRQYDTVDLLANGIGIVLGMTIFIFRKNF